MSVRGWAFFGSPRGESATYQPSNQGTRVFPPVKAPGTKIGGKMALVCSGRLIRSNHGTPFQGGGEYGGSLEMCQKCAHQLPFVAPTFFISATKDSRPALNRLMDDACNRRFDVMLVWRFDRFARSTKPCLHAHFPGKLA